MISIKKLYQQHGDKVYGLILQFEPDPDKAGLILINLFFQIKPEKIPNDKALLFLIQQTLKIIRDKYPDQKEKMIHMLKKRPVVFDPINHAVA